MIKKMTKYTFVVLDAEVETFLARLQELGVMDITRSSRAVDATSRAKFEMIEHCRRVIGQLKSLKSAEEKAGAEPSKADVSGIAKNDLLAAVDERLERRDTLKTAIAEAKAELAAAEPWGAFSAEDLAKIEAAGLIPHFYAASKKRYSEAWEQEYPIYKIGANEKNIYFVALALEGQPWMFPLAETQFPSRDAIAVKESLDALVAEYDRTNAELSAIAANLIPMLEEYRADSLSNVDLYLAKVGGESCAEGKLAVLEGFALAESEAQLKIDLENEPVYFEAEAAKAEDNPPIALKNNFFGKLYEPIGELYMYPKYNEHDLTGYFAPFYMLFFGLCMGDVGYGVVLLLLGLYVNFRMKEYANYGKLVAWLGFGTIIMPLLGGTFFGGKLYEMFPIPQNIADLFFSDLKMFWFAIIFGIVQIIFARFLKVCFAFADKDFTTGLGEIGWMLLITWCSVFYASIEAGFEVPAIATYIGAYGGLGLILLFSSNAKNIFVRLFKGVSALYDITGVFGDILSYIRLFGLGTAGGILGLVVNSVAMQMSGIPYLGWVLTIIMLLFGHMAVLALSALGAFVHPMRLTFVEFYKNVGFEGGGRKFRPLGK